jgi:hypothetical protein
MEILKIAGFAGTFVPALLIVLVLAFKASRSNVRKELGL